MVEDIGLGWNDPSVGRWPKETFRMEIDEVARMENLIWQHFLRLRRVFRYHSVAGSSQTISWNIRQFEMFVKQCKIKVRGG